MKQIPIFNYNIRNNSGEKLEVFIDGIIVDAETQEMYREWWNDQTSVSFKSFRSEILNSGTKNIKITINSFGGQIGDAMAMHDFIQDLENNQGYNIETVGMGMVCSAATYILSASKNSKISKNSWYMIHNVSGAAWGDVNDVEKAAKNLRNFNNKIRDFYVNLTGKSAQEIEDYMNAETWFNGEEAVANKFVKALVDNQQFAHAINQKDWAFKNTFALNAYNSYVAPKQENDKNFDNLNMKNIANIVGAAVANALVNANLFTKNEKGEDAPVTNELLTNAVEKAFEGIDFEAAINSAVDEQFKDGLPENIIAQITNAVKDSVKPENFKESEEWKNMVNRVKDVEEKQIKNAGQAKPKNTGGTEDKYADREDIGFSGE